jgi:hypothetical protein
MVRSKRFYAICAGVIAIVAALALAFAQAARATTYFEMEHESSGYCIDDPSNSTANGTPIQLWQCNADNNQKIAAIRSTYTDGGYAWDELQFENGKCIDDPNGSIANGQYYQIWTCNGDRNQAFYPQPDNGYENTWVQVTSGPAISIDDRNNSNTNGNEIQVWETNYGNSQIWQGPVALPAR